MNLIKYSRTLRKNPTDAERKLWFHINQKQIGGLKFRRQFIIDNKYIVDFVCLERKIIIEIDGGQHSENTDYERTEYLKKIGFDVIRFWNNEVLQNIEGVLQVINKKLGIK